MLALPEHQEFPWIQIIKMATLAEVPSPEAVDVVEAPQIQVLSELSVYL
jgi:hypothetical protein